VEGHTVIQKITRIDSFAVFKDFNWDDIARDRENKIAEFKKRRFILLGGYPQHIAAIYKI
jgi:hypothetical protein